jgi:hypothetical protein
VAGDISNEVRIEVSGRADHRCEYCLIHESDAGFPHKSTILSAGSMVDFPVRTIWHTPAFCVTGTREAISHRLHRVLKGLSLCFIRGVIDVSTISAWTENVSRQFQKSGA